jgi:hypothetical protein
LNDLEITINKSLEDLQTLKEAIQSRDKLIAVQQELDIARTIQTSILPKTFPAFPDNLYTSRPVIQFLEFLKHFNKESCR